MATTPATSQRYSVFRTADSMKVMIPGLKRTKKAWKLGISLCQWQFRRLLLMLVKVKKYNRPEAAATISQLRRIPACMLISAVQLPTWNLEMISRSRAIFTITLTELIRRGTSGLSKALVAFEIATSIAELNAEKALIRTYVTLDFWTSCGTNVAENAFAALANTILMMSPRMAWNITRVCANPKRDSNGRACLSAIVTHTARGRPSFNTSAMVPMYV